MALVKNERSLPSVGRLGRNNIIEIIFSLLSLPLLLFVLLPILATFFSTDPAALIDALIQPDVVASLLLTFGAALIATSITLIAGVPLAYLLARKQFRGKRLIEAIIDLPVVIPHTAAGIALLMVFGQRSVVGKAFAPLGVYFTDNLTGIVIAMLFVSLPFLVDTARESFCLVDPRFERVARTLGTPPMEAFWRVSLPLAWPGILAGALLMWARGISEFGAIVILAYNPKIIPVLIFERFEGFGLAAALPVTVILILVSLAVFAILRAMLLRRDRLGERR